MIDISYFALGAVSAVLLVGGIETIRRFRPKKGYDL